MSAKLPSAILIIAGIASLYISFYQAEEYERSATSQLSVYNRLKSLYLSVQADTDPAAAKSDFDAIDAHYYSTTMSKQIFLSGWYAHYKLFAGTQIGWMDEQKKFTLKDKWSVSARITIIVGALGHKLINGIELGSGLID